MVADCNGNDGGNDGMVGKFQGEFPFHKHETTDDVLCLPEGEMVMELEGQPSQIIKAGELFIVPKGVVHRTMREVKVLRIEPNSGDAGRQPAPKPGI